eukprot:CAMPEP_0116841160 /NCGR_PEP_ID=MMETSP0418-20121206/10770_1 /TAXON_ID=1158023 /ORGANISM="Astrosyne radiata, Strain 13vi08-1A" /LENGTH=370 /DNA_ID=CAMNT_0004471555 /DNA_START=94 /DNA_END=1206 /DNA_ORIENTATION=-
MIRQPQVGLSTVSSLIGLVPLPQQQHRSLYASTRDENAETESDDNRQTPTDATTDKKKKKKSPGMSTGTLLRADRVLGNRGFGSRKICHAILRQRRAWIYQEDGTKKILASPSEKIPLDAKLFVDKEEIPEIPLLLVYHKPKYLLSQMDDDDLNRPHLGMVLSDYHYAQKDVHPVGRLDYDTSGLILFSSNGQLTQRLLHPNGKTEKEYTAVVQGIVDPERLERKFKAGVETKEGVHTAQILGIESPIAPEEVMQIVQDVQHHGSDHYMEEDKDDEGGILYPTMPYGEDDDDDEEQEMELCMSRIRLVVTEGKHRMVRRMLANCGHPVWALRRDRIGNISLGDLPEGCFRDITEDETTWAQGLISTKKKP